MKRQTVLAYDNTFVNKCTVQQRTYMKSLRNVSYNPSHSTLLTNTMCQQRPLLCFFIDGLCLKGLTQNTLQHLRFNCLWGVHSILVGPCCIFNKWIDCFFIGESTAFLLVNWLLFYWWIDCFFYFSISRRAIWLLPLWFTNGFVV